MVAYSFRSQFVAAIVERRKRQTIRLPRRRHAVPGEAIQLYQGMRTRSCKKIIDDPTCVAVDRLVIDTRSGWLDHLEVNGVQIDPSSEEADIFAIADGFSGALFITRPINVMARWWLLTHGRCLHEDLVLVRWEDR